MQEILARKSVGLTELREPGKVIAEAGDEPVAIMNRNEVAGYFVPASAVNKLAVDTVSRDQAMEALKARESVTANGVSYLEDK